MEQFVKSLSTMDAPSITVRVIQVIVSFAHTVESAGALGTLEPDILSKIKRTEECIVDLVRISIVYLANMTVEFSNFHKSSRLVIGAQEGTCRAAHLSLQDDGF